ncbi:hypothetical protein GOP47_0013550 [Adiantum capillus-veneris]|uniref:Pectate lyase n=1 Tax=Adiantum capillus-veneris TaxID=13818 RepID=A0A9D4UNR1_ADICA|nr:hypothetical protein GOP47_0013550 [Adiantum capillus-veneris]
MRRLLHLCSPRRSKQQWPQQPVPPHPTFPPPPIVPPPPHHLPYHNVDVHLQAIAGQAEGFGCHSVGGLHGEIYHVTTLNEDGEGSLRFACKSNKPLWIVFDVSGIIKLSSAIRVQSYKTVDGRGQRVKIMGKGFQLRECEHVIICNLEFEGGRGDDVDAMQLKSNSKHIWIDRCSLSDYDDGLIDIRRQCTDITVSKCHFFNHNKTMLIGADPSHVDDQCIRVTIHHCFFDGTRQRHPRVRFGKVHLYNNYTQDWGIYAVCASVESQVLSQCNIYEAGSKKKAFEYYFEKASDKHMEASGSICSEGDMFLNGAVGVSKNSEPVFRPEALSLRCSISHCTRDLVSGIRSLAGWQQVLGITFFSLIKNL